MYFIIFLCCHGGTGRHNRLKICRGDPCRFDSGWQHQNISTELIQCICSVLCYPYATRLSDALLPLLPFDFSLPTGFWDTLLLRSFFPRNAQEGKGRDFPILPMGKSSTPNHVRDLLPRVHLHVARKAGGRPSWPRTGSAQHNPCHLTAACRRRSLHGPSARGTAPQPGAGASRTKELYSVCVRVRILSHSDAECIFSKTCRIASLVPFGSFMVSGCGAPAPSVPDKTTPYLRDPFPRSI